MITLRIIRLIVMKNELKGQWQRCQVTGRMFLFCCVLLPLLVQAEEAWTKGLPLVTRPQSDIKEGPFILAVWSGMNNHVHGLCSYVNVRAKAVGLHGIQLKNGDFYPTVKLFVADASDKWTAIESSSQRGQKASVVVKPRAEPEKTLKIDLDPFLPYIRKYKLGRIAIETGESAVFELSQLLPPEAK
jgi:hypothetical protein